MISKHLYLASQHIRARLGRIKQVPKLMAALDGDPAALSLFRAKKLITLEEFNYLQMAKDYRAHIEPVELDDGRPVFANIYDLLLIYDRPYARGGWIYRGQADASWDYSPSEARLSDYLETECWRDFRGRFLTAVCQQYPELYKDYWEMLALAQHYRFKTMLLDFTFSPQVAAFFATNDPASNAQIGCIMRISKSDFESLHLGEIRILESPKKNERLRRQEGCFVTRFNPAFLGERGLFDALCFRHTPNPEIYKDGTRLTMNYLFPSESDDPIRQIADLLLQDARKRCKLLVH